MFTILILNSVESGSGGYTNLVGVVDIQIFDVIPQFGDFRNISFEDLREVVIVNS
jgi:hypothetical protein